MLRAICSQQETPGYKPRDRHRLSTFCYHSGMLARYKMYRGSRPPEDPLPAGIRQDTRKHTRHCLRPTEQLVAEFLAAPTSAQWKSFQQRYNEILKERHSEDRAPFDILYQQAKECDVFIGCSCPTAKNPNVEHCHTVLALRFMKKRYPKLDVRFP